MNYDSGIDDKLINLWERYNLIFDINISTKKKLMIVFEISWFYFQIFNSIYLYNNCMILIYFKITKPISFLFILNKQIITFMKTIEKQIIIF